MGGPIEHIILLRVGDGPSVAARPVNIAASQCRDPADFEMMLAVVEASTGGARAFNTRLEALLASLDVPSAPSMPVSSSSSLVIITDAQPDDVRRDASRPRRGSGHARARARAHASLESARVHS
jgi:hypothetical protein